MLKKVVFQSGIPHLITREQFEDCCCGGCEEYSGCPSGLSASYVINTVNTSPSAGDLRIKGGSASVTLDGGSTCNYSTSTDLQEFDGSAWVDKPGFVSLVGMQELFPDSDPEHWIVTLQLDGEIGVHFWDAPTCFPISSGGSPTSVNYVMRGVTNTSVTVT